MKFSFSSWPMISVFLIIMNFIIILFTIDLVKNNKVLVQELSRLQQSKAEAISNLSRYNLFPYSIVGQKIDSTMTLIDTNNEKMIIDDIVDAKGLWILRYFNNSCSSCYEQSISKIRFFFNKQETDRCAVLTDFQNIYQLRNFKSKTHFICEVFATDSIIDFLPETINLPYLMKIENNGVITSCFVIQKDNLSLLEQILKTIFNEY